MTPRWWMEPGGRGRGVGSPRTETFGAVVAAIGLALCLTPWWLVGVPLLAGGALTLGVEHRSSRSTSQQPTVDTAAEDWTALDERQVRRLLDTDE